MIQVAPRRKAPGPVRLLSCREAASRLGISERLLWSLYNRGEIPHVRIGRCVRFDPGDLEDWIEHRKEGGRGHGR